MARSGPSELAEEIGSIIGPVHVRPPVGREALVARTLAEPGSVEEISEIVRKCERDKIPLAPVGAARTLSAIRPEPVAIAVSLKRLSGVVAYEPDDMTIVAEAGITLGELNRLTAANRQRLPLDPPNPDLTVIGAMIGASRAGPLRLSEGTVRDLLIGIRFVGCAGRRVHAGGTVVKNVAGYDLMKVLTGSFGTLGVITEAAFKLRPVPESYALALKDFAAGAEAFEAAALNDAFGPCHLEVLSPGLAASFDRRDRFMLLAGIAGSAAEVEHYSAIVTRTLGARAELLIGDCALQTYRRLRDLAPPDFSLSARISVAPGELFRSIEGCRAEFCAHAGSGVAELFLKGGLSLEDARETVERWLGSAHRGRGHLRVLSTPAHLHGSIAMFDDPGAGALDLMRRLKARFDPARVFNPRCFVGGI